MFVYKHIEKIEYVEKQANFLIKMQSLRAKSFYNNNSQKIVQKTIQKINLIFFQLLKSWNDEERDFQGII